MTDETEPKRGRGQPPKPYKTDAIRLPNLGPSGWQFIEALGEAMKQAAKRKPKDDRFVYLYRATEGDWRVATDREDVPKLISAMTEGVLIVYATGDVGIST